MGKAKDGSECYTRQNKSGGSYVTCEGTQKSGKSKSKSIPPNSARARGRRSAAARKLRPPPGRIGTGIINPGIVETGEEFARFVAPAKNIDPRLPFSSTNVFLEEYDESFGPDIASTTAPGFQVTTLPGDIYEIKDGPFTAEQIAEGDATEEYVGKVSKEFVKIEFVEDDSDEDKPDWPTEEDVMKVSGLKELRVMARRFADHSGRGDFPEEFQVDNSGVDELKKVKGQRQIDDLRKNILKGVEIEKKLYRPSTPDPDALPPGTMLLMIDGNKIFDKNPEFDNDKFMRFQWDDEDTDDEYTDEETEEEIEEETAGVVMPEGPSASFEGLFGSVAPEPVEDDQDINEDILSEVIPGLFEGMGSGVPVGDRPVYAGDFLDVLNVISERSAERETDKQEIFAKYEPYSIGQLSTAYRKHFKANNPGYVTSVPKYISKEGIIKWIVKSGMPDSYLPKSGRKEPKTKWYLQGWILDDDDDDSVLVGGLESYGFELEETYPNGSAMATAMLTKQELLKFVTNERENFEDYTDLYNLYTDSRGYRGKGMVWEGLK